MLRTVLLLLWLPTIGSLVSQEIPEWKTDRWRFRVGAGIQWSVSELEAPMSLDAVGEYKEGSNTSYVFEAAYMLTSKFGVVNRIEHSVHDQTEKEFTDLDRTIEARYGQEFFIDATRYIPYSRGLETFSFYGAGPSFIIPVEPVNLRLTATVGFMEFSNDGVRYRLKKRGEHEVDHYVLDFEKNTSSNGFIGLSLGTNLRAWKKWEGFIELSAKGVRFDMTLHRRLERFDGTVSEESIQIDKDLLHLSFHFGIGYRL